MEQSSQLKIMIADGSSLITKGSSKVVSWEAQGHEFTIDFLVISIKGCDVVLEVQWLLSLGSILWNFRSLTMQFEHQNKFALYKAFM